MVYAGSNESEMENCLRDKNFCLKNYFFNATIVQIAPKRSMAPMPISMGDVYFNITKAVKHKKTSILVGIVNLKNAVLFCTPVR